MSDPDREDYRPGILRAAPLVPRRVRCEGRVIRNPRAGTPHSHSPACVRSFSECSESSFALGIRRLARCVLVAGPTIQRHAHRRVTAVAEPSRRSMAPEARPAEAAVNLLPVTRRVYTNPAADRLLPPIGKDPWVFAEHDCARFDARAPCGGWGWGAASTNAN